MAVARTWIRTSALLGAILSLLDVVAGSGSVAAALWAFLVGLGGGLLVGAVLGLAFAGAERLPAWLGISVWPSIGLIVGVLGASSLGAFSKIGGEHSGWALLALIGGAAAGAALGGLCAMLQPTSRYSEGWVASRHRAIGVAVATVAAAIAVAAAWADRSLWIGLYPTAHTGLRALGFVCCVVAGMSLPRVRRPLARRIENTVLAVTVIGALVPFVGLRASHEHTLRTLVERPFSGEALRLARALTDVDFDGHSSLLGGGDCAPFDGDIHPGAVEIPGNGVDENCSAGDAVAAAASDPNGVPIPDEPSPVSVLLITVDTTRPDHMSLYGYGRDTTPNLTGWAKESGARLFRRAYTGGCHTASSFLSMMRGVSSRKTTWKSNPNPMQFPQLAWWLKRRGMVTAAVVNDGTRGYLSRDRGFAQGFDIYVRLSENVAGNSRFLSEDDRTTTKAAIQVLSAVPRTKPFFMWVHYFGPHAPSTLAQGHPSFGDDEVAAYDNEISYWDVQVIRLLSAAAERENLIVIVTADHGEELPARTHGSVEEAVIRVPLVMAGPGISPGTDDRLVSLLDLLPTVAGMTRTPVHGAIEGIDLSSYDPDRIVLSDCHDFHGNDLVAAIAGERKLVYDVATNTYEATGAGDMTDLRAAIARQLETVESR